MSNTTKMKLLSPYKMGDLQLANRLVMSPLTRSRATADHVPTPLMAEYYGQRATAGLIVTEGTSPSPNGLGYARIPGIYSEEQVAAWKPVTEAVHKNGGHIFMQLMHTGRITHVLNLPEGARVVAPSAIQAAGQMYTDQEGLQDHTVPEEMSLEDIKTAVEEYAQAARNAMRAGFDGVELHGANGYLLSQFLAPNANRRTDAYGGSIPNRAAFVLEVVDATVAAIGAARVGIRFSPHSLAGDFAPDPAADELYAYLAEELNRRGIAYIHLVDHSSLGGAFVPQELKDKVRSAFKNTLILAGGYDAERAEADVEAGRADLVAFGRAFLANPDFVARVESGAPLNDPDRDTFYTPGAAGYTDYPSMTSKLA